MTMANHLQVPTGVKGFKQHDFQHVEH
jgi:hypothetical protein